MGLLERHTQLAERKTEREEQNANPEEQWEYLARNLAKVPGMALETDFNKLGAKGWEFVAMASGGREGYAIFKRRTH